MAYYPEYLQGFLIMPSDTTHLIKLNTLTTHTHTHNVSQQTHTLKNSHPVHHMQISTHPEEPLHFLRTSRPTMLHLCGHFFTSEKAQWLTILLRSILGEGGRNGNKCVAQRRPLFSGYTLV